MNKLILLLSLFSLHIFGYSQPNIKRIDSVVKAIEAKKTLTVNNVSDTFPTQHANLLTIENVKFYSTGKKLVKAVFSTNYFRKDSTSANILTGLEVFYFNEDILVKVISKDFDQSPPKDLQFYLNEKGLKKFLAKETMNSRRYDGANYFIEIGYGLLDEFKLLTKK